jgi:hypothetical protein
MLYIKISNSWKNGLLILFTQVLLGRKVLYQIIAEDIYTVRDFGFLNTRTPTAGLYLQFDTATSG